LKTSGKRRSNYCPLPSISNLSIWRSYWIHWRRIANLISCWCSSGRPSWLVSTSRRIQHF